jgi:uncharacterized membrane protein
VKFFPWQRPKDFFTAEEKDRIVEAIRHAEHRTSGEVRVFIESRCRYVDAIDRAARVFFRLEMDKTENRNAALVYVALKDRQLAVYGDENIHKKVGDQYWNSVVKKMLENFNRENYAEGIRQCITEIGEALHTHFPYDSKTDKNELPDDIVFGK